MLIDWVDGWVDDWVVKRMTSWCCMVDVNMIWMDFHMIGWRLDEFEYVGGWKDRWMNGWILDLILCSPSLLYLVSIKHTVLVDDLVLYVCRSWLSMVAAGKGEEMFEHILLSSLIQYDSVSFLSMTVSMDLERYLLGRISCWCKSKHTNL